jgi:predicted Rossmann fold nucleotide-binding protein DprA/Smf involved in DNA uptake
MEDAMKGVTDEMLLLEQECYRQELAIAASVRELLRTLKEDAMTDDEAQDHILSLLSTEPTPYRSVCTQSGLDSGEFERLVDNLEDDGRVEFVDGADGLAIRKVE